MDLIRQQGEFVALAAEDDQPGLVGPADASHPVEPVKVDNGEDLAAKVDDADDEVGRPGNRCQFDQGHDLVDIAQFDRVVFVGQREGHDIEHQRGGGAAGRGRATARARSSSTALACSGVGRGSSPIEVAARARRSRIVRRSVIGPVRRRIKLIGSSSSRPRSAPSGSRPRPVAAQPVRRRREGRSLRPGEPGTGRAHCDRRHAPSRSPRFWRIEATVRWAMASDRSR